MSPRHALLALLLAGTLAAAFWPRDEADTLVEAVVKSKLSDDGNGPCGPAGRPCRALPGPSPWPSPAGRGEKQPPPPMGEGGGEGSGRNGRFVGAAGKARFATAGAVNLFPRQSFRPPPRPVAPAPVLPPPPPMAPPVPFSYVGAWTENGQETIFLSRGEQVISTHRGATLPGGWRLDAVSPEALTFTYVTLNQQRTLRIAP